MKASGPEGLWASGERLREWGARRCCAFGLSVNWDQVASGRRVHRLSAEHLSIQASSIVNQNRYGDPASLERVQLKTTQGSRPGPGTHIRMRREDFQHPHASKFAAWTAIYRVGFRFVRMRVRRRESQRYG